MNEKLNEKSCAEFSKLLSSKAPVPGGGGAAALVGALGISLGEMAANLTIGKKKYAEFETELNEAVSECDALRLELLEYIELDAAAFEPLSKAYSMPKDAPDHDQIMREATIRAADAPYQMVKLCCRCVSMLERLEAITSTLLISDVACGAALSGAALEAAALNVFVNTRLLRGDPEADAMESDTKARLEQYRPLAEQIARRIESKLLEG